ncbi:response regulator transcription factor [Congregibacter litoralis]|uniref:Two component transcriptional regulator, LuxR family n=1 Tax=Congregibacter litoralis KT71 TaxID=314285 RepID=A4A426_9GAMM|nr:response regulator transcription factor [Congregibacter litoralis]EAQ99449.1 two component transcriptional regulator, LuxR family [Congregibacter litoralis KT71]
MKCIIADDHPLFRDALSMLLSGSDIDADISHAENVAELHDLVEKDGAPDLLLLDLHMPGASGFSALGWFVGNYPDKPVIIVSAHVQADTVRRAIDHGAAAFLSKSSGTDVMTACIRDVLAGNRGLHPGLDISESGASLKALDVADALASLTPQQFRVASMLVEGLLNKQIAYELGVKEATIKAHMTEVFRKLGVQSRTQAVLAIGNLTIAPAETAGESL